MKATKAPLILELFGWYGMIAILIAFTLSSFGYTEVNSLPHALLNTTGSLGILSISYYKQAYQPMLLNIIWLLITLVAVV